VRYSDTVLGEGPSLRDWLHARLEDVEYAAIRTGFLSLAAVDDEGPGLVRLLQRGGRLLVVAGGAPDQADPDALVRLGDVLSPFGDQAVLRVVVEPEEFQNAKTYYLRFADGHVEAWVGSANFTRGGLSTNHEAAIQLDSREAADVDVIDKVRQGTELFQNRPGAVGVSEEIRLVLAAGRLRRVRETGHKPRMWSTHAWADLLQPGIDRLDQIASNSPVPYGVPTGFADFDEVTNGLHAGTLTIVASRPGVGRSTLLLDFARNAAIRNTLRTAVFCLDQASGELTQRVLSAEARIRLADMRGGRMTDADWTRLARRMAEIVDAPLLLNCTPAAELDALCAEICGLGESEPLALVAVDPINMIRTRTEAGANREREFSLIARRLKTLALELNVPVVVTAELRREVDGRIDHRPTMNDLREGDVLAQVADMVVLLHRPDYYERDDPRAGEADLILAKHRNGPTATITVAHQLHYSRFADLAL
jgi:hypothetical protein